MILKCAFQQSMDIKEVHPTKKHIVCQQKMTEKSSNLQG